MTARAAELRAVYRCPRGHEQWHSGTCTATGCRRITDLHRWVAIEPLTPAPPLEELLEAGRGLATVAEEMRAHDPQTVDAALLRWIRAVVGQRNAATLLDTLEALARDERPAYEDALAYEVAKAVGVTEDELDSDAEWTSAEELPPVSVGVACEQLAGALVRLAQDRAADAQAEAEDARKADVAAWRRDVL